MAAAVALVFPSMIECRFLCVPEKFCTVRKRVDKGRALNALTFSNVFKFHKSFVCCCWSPRNMEPVPAANQQQDQSQSPVTCSSPFLVATGCDALPAQGVVDNPASDLDDREAVAAFCKMYLAEHPGSTYLDIKKAIQDAVPTGNSSTVVDVPKRKVNSVLYEMERNRMLRREAPSVGKPRWFLLVDV